MTEANEFDGMREELQEMGESPGLTSDELMHKLWEHRIASAVNIEICGRSLITWVTKGAKNERGKQLEFSDRAFLKDVYDDFARIQVVRKSAQIGFTTLKIIKSLWAAYYKHWNIIYTLPTFQMMQDIASSKVSAIIANNEIMAYWLKNKDSVFQKQVGDNFIYYRGAASGKMDTEKMETGVGISLTSDLNIHDECDRSDQSVLEQYESRLEASDYGGRWYFSNPTSPHTLSQVLYEKSDQKHWFVKCKNGHWQYLDFFKHLKGENYVCEKCGAIITDNDRRSGRWVKKYRDKDISGYWISHLMCPWISPQKIKNDYEEKSKQYFYNFILGLPYVGSDVVVNKDTILRAIDYGPPNFQKDNVMGVDSGLKKHYVIGNNQGIFKVGALESWNDIEELIKIYDIGCCVIDALPDLTEPRKLRDKYLGKIWLCYYKKEIQRADFIKWDYQTYTVYSDRSKIFQQVIDEISSKKIRYQMKVQELEDYISQWGSLYKMTEKDSLGIERDSWESGGDDHFCHATNYFRLALEKGGTAKIGEWKKPEKEGFGLAPLIKKFLKPNYE